MKSPTFSILCVLVTSIFLGGIPAAHGAIITNDTTIGSTDTNFEGSAIMVTNCTLTIDGNHSFSSLQILQGGVVTHPPATALLMNLTVSNNVEIEVGGAIDLNGRGFGSGSGPGAGASRASSTGILAGAGGGYGGYGGTGSTLAPGGNSYGSVVNPTDKGSGGGVGSGPGAAGGGAMKLVVNGLLRVDGRIAANGANGSNPRAGGGSGGSLWLTATSLSGSGSITANGGDGEPFEGGGGGGGRISMKRAAILASGGRPFSGSVSAHAGRGWTGGGAGTVYTLIDGEAASNLLIDNGGLQGTNTLTSAVVGSFDLTISGGAIVMSSPTFPLPVFSIRNLVITSNSWLVARPGGSMARTITGNANIQSGGGISADGCGYGGGQGTGRGGSSSDTSTNGPTGGGGGYGGYGGTSLANAAGGIGYGTATQSSELGSGGGNGNGRSPSNLGGAGGGALQIAVNGTLVLDGKITANGLGSHAPGSGGGSGGSLWLTIGKLTGSGTISADGGPGELPFGGGGGGGRIALYYATNQFDGTLSARGGSGGNFGGAGTIFFSMRNLPPVSSSQVLVDNGGNQSTNTLLPALTPAFDLSVTGGAIVDPSNLYNVHNLFIGSNSWLRPLTGSTRRTLNVTGQAVVERGGAILMDGRGYPAGAGPGQGHTLSSGLFPITAGGGGYGGYGGNSTFGAGGGSPYGAASAPEEFGSGGGVGAAPQGQLGFSGSGGGALMLTVNGPLLLDGRISADGAASLAANGGGGSGGAIQLRVGSFYGSGVISANGGAGQAPYGGGGGGGRIAVRVISVTNLFTGLLSARGGQGAGSGGAGTIYEQDGNANARLVVDNGGLRGAPTSLSGLETSLLDLSISGGAVATVTPAFGLQAGSLTIRSNSTLLATNQNTGPVSVNINISSNAVIEAGGSIVLNGAGYPAGAGPGAGRYATSPASGGGGAYAGYGGASAFGAAGGAAYGGLIPSFEPGSGGGGSIVQAGAGGGGLRMTVRGQLILNGNISADGASATGSYSGGGSGGGLVFTVGTLIGKGLVSVDGGTGDPPYGGGGGGGRISLTCSTNLFSGTYSAQGGAGANRGGAGTVYLHLQNSSQNSGQLIVDNGGLPGATTLPSSTGSFPADDWTITGGAVLAPRLSSPFALVRLYIATNSWLTIPALEQTFGLSLAFGGNGTAVIESGGGISLDGKGSSFGLGQGGTSPSSPYGTSGGGGGYGGFGGTGLGNASGGRAYGSITQPIDGGSGGGRTWGTPASGGGAFRLTMPGTLTLNGRISSDGSSTSSEGGGGGSGGSIWLEVGALTGSGTISADGGDGDPFLGGGGGGGRIAVYLTSVNQPKTAKSFVGTISAFGGTGITNGGAGTIYLSVRSSNSSTLIVDNGGNTGAPTPLSGLVVPPLTSLPFALPDLRVAGGAVAYPSGSNLLLNSLVVDSGAELTHFTNPTNLDLWVFRNADIKTNAAISVDGKGYNGPNPGPGGGQMQPRGSGSGGGYGGAGGASLSGQPGGESYGSALEPAMLGSRGGLYPVVSNACEGGGAVRLRVTGTLTVDGRLSADGHSAQIESAGGGAGGSIWVTTRQLAGNGLISALGGDGNPFEGGGGGGGRIAVYSGTNTFTGPILAVGGEGASRGEDGTIVLTNLPPLRVISQVPDDVVSHAVNSILLSFNSPLAPNLPLQTDLSVLTPVEMLPEGSLSLSHRALTNLSVGLPLQTTPGYYEVRIGTAIEDIYGASLEEPYIGSFVIMPPVISGRIIDTNGLPVPYVTLTASSDLLPALTDTNGFYSLEVLPDWTGTVTPSRAGWRFMPLSRSYSHVNANLTGQNYIMATPGAFELTLQHQGNSISLQWLAVKDIRYQPMFSTNLVDWLPCEGGPFQGTNTSVSIPLPDANDPMRFYRLDTIE